jgi:hypothetical protein
MAFTVEGLDSEGNTFTTLDRIEFDWQISEITGGQILEFTNYSAQTYFDETMEELQQEGKTGYKRLVKGQEHGQCS